MYLRRVRSSRINVLRLVAACCLVAGVILIPSAAFAAHADNSSSIRYDRDNNVQGFDYHYLTQSGRVACRWGQARLENNTVIQTQYGNRDIHCYDAYYNNKGWFGYTQCIDVNRQGRCDQYTVQFNLKYYGSNISNASQRRAYRYIGCHEFGHTSSLGHRPVDRDDNSCMSNGSGNMYFDVHDNRAINRDI